MQPGEHTFVERSQTKNTKKVSCQQHSKNKLSGPDTYQHYVFTSATGISTQILEEVDRTQDCPALFRIRRTSHVVDNPLRTHIIH